MSARAYLARVVGLVAAIVAVGAGALALTQVAGRSARPGGQVAMAAQASAGPPPNVLIVLLDDQGYGQSSTFGGLIPTPTMDRLAAQGLRYTRFQVTALCSPTRAALLTGRNNHAVNMGVITNWATDNPGYNAAIPRSAAMMPEILRQHGYSTAAFGKWHLIPEREVSLAGPFDHWPTHQGFDYFYGFLNGETNQWRPELIEGVTPVEMVAPPGREADYTLSEHLADKAIGWIKAQKSADPNRPFFIYYAPGASHAPLQAPKAWIDRFRGKFDMGWDAYREQVFARQKALGVIPPDTRLTPRPPEIPAWSSLSPDQQKVAARLMEIYAAFTAQNDHELGRVIDAIAATGQLDNTLIVYVAGDNGASLEGGLNGTANLMGALNGAPETTADMLARLDELGGPHSLPHYPVGWAWAGNTPFQWGKRIGSHLGGTRDPMIVSWPRRIKDRGGVRYQFQDVTDLMPTILEAAGVKPPTRVNGVPQQRIDGVSMTSTFASARAPETRTRQYSEMLGNRSIYDHGWMAAARSGILPWVFPERRELMAAQPWELYDLDHDYSEAKDLAAANPRKLKAMRALFDQEARANHVYPLNPVTGGRQERPAGLHFVWYGRSGHNYVSMTPPYEDRSHTITAYVDMPAEGGDGVLVADGAESGGFSLFVRDGRPTYVYNYFQRTISTVSAPQRLKPGPAKITLAFVYDGGGRGLGATAILSVDDIEVGRVRIPATLTTAFSYEDTFDVGEDSASPVADYRSPFPFTGDLKRVELDLAPG
jgi:arylsulfatase A-like enzyme